MTVNKTTQETYAILFKHLLHGPMTAHELAGEASVHIVTAQRLMRVLMQYKVVHITAWDKDSKGRDATPVYQLGEGRNKKRAKMTTAERTQRYRAKKEALQLQNLIVKRKTDEVSAL